MNFPKHIIIGALILGFFSGYFSQKIILKKKYANKLRICRSDLKIASGYINEFISDVQNKQSEQNVVTKYVNFSKKRDDCSISDRTRGMLNKLINNQKPAPKALNEKSRTTEANSR